ncbi:AI-2E family transporter [Ruegeria arenilitoris]|uniref:AI-2E family transporter n=1 Tax=Ruegeria arenilitoris TaxID=1173585 RepID=UPI0014813CC9|nr:AI-2E family transporter [Ruegeria arenilitoris]
MPTAFSSPSALRAMLAILTGIAIITALYLARSIVAPITFALVLGVVVAPLADKLEKVGCPRVISASALLFVTSTVIVAAFLLLEPLLSTLVEQLPAIKRELRSWVAAMSEFIRGIETLGREIEETVGADGAAETESALPSVMDALWLAPNFGSKILIFIGTLFFFVLTRPELYAAAGPLTERLYLADRAVYRYFAAVTLVNIGLGTVTAVALGLIGINDAVIWGVAAGLLNFVLYLGPLMILTGLLIAGLTQFGGAAALLPPLIFLAINLSEAQFVTPAFVGQRLQVNPLVVFIAIIFGLWLWGPVGAIVALPILLWFGVLMHPKVMSPVSTT